MEYAKKAVVTGATGMLALALMRKLSYEGYKIYAVARPNSSRIDNIPKQDNITVVECDLSEIETLPDKIYEKCDDFFHFAWEATYGAARNDMSAQLRNISASVNAVKAAHALGCNTFLGAGSQAEYGRKSEKISPCTSANPENGYGIAKLCAGQMTRVMCQELGIKHIWCRIFSTYGPYDGEQTMVMSGILRMLKGERPSYTKGEQEWDYLYCDDAAEAFYLAAKNGKNGSTYCIGSGKTRLLKDYIYAIRDTVNSELEIGIGEVPYFENQVMYLCADITSLTRDTGFVPKFSFEEGIRLTVEWAKNKEKK